MSSFVSKCNLCSNPFKDPKLLPCYHTFCQSCLYEYVGKNSRNEHFPCPTCEQLIYAPKNIKTGFPVDYYADIQASEVKALQEEETPTYDYIDMYKDGGKMLIRKDQNDDSENYVNFVQEGLKGQGNERKEDGKVLDRDIDNDSENYVNFEQDGLKKQGNEAKEERTKDGTVLKKTNSGDKLGDHKCDVCMNGVLAEYACKECDQHLCVECYHVHSSMGGTKNHAVLKLKSSQIPDLVQRMCETHEEGLRFYCKNCHQGICVHCKMGDHAGHPIEHVVDATPSGRKDLRQMTDSLSSHLRSLNCELEALNYRKRLVKNACNETVAAIKIHADEICKQVNRIRDVKIQAAREFQDKQIVNIEGSEKLIQDQEVKVSAMNDYVKRVFASGSDVGLLETRDQIRDKVSQTEAFECPCVDAQCTEFDSKLPVSPSIDSLFGRIKSYPALRMRLSYGSSDSFACGSRGKAVSVDAVFAIGNNMAWVASHGSHGPKSTLALYSSKGELLDVLTCDNTVKCFSLLDKVVHVLTSDSFLKLNEGKSFFEPIVTESHPTLVASNSTSMFCMYKDLTCHYVTNTSVKPMATTALCSLTSVEKPVKMTIDENQNIAIVDATLKSVLLFDFDGNIKLKFSITYPEFRPIDLWIDEWSDILVVDGGNDAIHELSSDGESREIMYSSFSGLKNTSCISGDSDTWWFGSRDGKISVKYFDSHRRLHSGSSSCTLSSRGSLTV